MKTTEPSITLVPAGGLVLTNFTDIHKNRLEVLWKAWGPHEESWGIEHVVIPGEVQDDAIWTELDREYRRKFDHAFGCQIGLSFGLIDAGKWPDWVHKFLRRLAGFKAFNGDPLPGSPIRGKIRASRGWGGPASHKGVYPVINHRYTSIAGNLKGHWIGTDAAKGLIYDRAKLEPPEDGKKPGEASRFPDGFMHYPAGKNGEVIAGFDEDFMKQIFVERPILDPNGVRRFKNEGQYRNEGLDLEVGNLAAFRWLRIGASRFDAIEKDLKRQAEEAKNEKSGGITKKETPQRKRGNFIKSGGGRVSFWNR